MEQKRFLLLFLVTIFMQAIYNMELKKTFSSPIIMLGDENITETIFAKSPVIQAILQYSPLVDEDASQIDLFDVLEENDADPEYRILGEIPVSQNLLLSYVQFIENDQLEPDFESFVFYPAMTNYLLIPDVTNIKKRIIRNILKNELFIAYAKQKSNNNLLQKIEALFQSKKKKKNIECLYNLLNGDLKEIFIQVMQDEIGVYEVEEFDGDLENVQESVEFNNEYTVDEDIIKEKKIKTSKGNAGKKNIYFRLNYNSKNIDEASISLTDLNELLITLTKDTKTIQYLLVPYKITQKNIFLSKSTRAKLYKKFENDERELIFQTDENGLIKSLFFTGIEDFVLLPNTTEYNSHAHVIDLQNYNIIVESSIAWYKYSCCGKFVVTYEYTKYPYLEMLIIYNMNTWEILKKIPFLSCNYLNKIEYINSTVPGIIKLIIETAMSDEDDITIIQNYKYIKFTDIVQTLTTQELIERYITAKRF